MSNDVSIDEEIATEVNNAELARRVLTQALNKMTWGTFKSRVEANGVKDEDPIFMIEIHCPNSDEPLRVVQDRVRSKLRGIQITMEY